jgi:hypothetical protein
MQQGEIVDRVWKVIRCKKVFTLIELIIIAEVKRETARWYLKQLRAAGIVKPSAEAGPGVEWTLLKDPGPKRPHTGRGDRPYA